MQNSNPVTIYLRMSKTLFIELLVIDTWLADVTQNEENRNVISKETRKKVDEDVLLFFSAIFYIRPTYTQSFFKGKVR